MATTTARSNSAPKTRPTTAATVKNKPAPAPVPSTKTSRSAVVAVPAKTGAAAKNHVAAKPVATKPVATKAAPVEAPVKLRKLALVRDSFTMPEADFALVATLKKRAVGFARPAKKSELLRAGLHALEALNDAQLKAALDALAPIKSGRPKKS